MYYQKTIQDIFNELDTSIYGLNDIEVTNRQKKYGKNILNPKKEDSPIIVFIKQFTDLLVIILLISALISMFANQFESSIVIIVVVILNALLGTIQTLKARASLQSLQQLSSPIVRVIRNNQLIEINSQELTIGDVVSIEAGDMINGDGRIVECSGLSINESSLTGESLSVEKTTSIIENSTCLAEQKNMVFSGSLVVNGVGKYVVTHIGMNSEIGKIAGYLNDSKEKKTPIQKSLDQFSLLLSIGIIIICIIVFLINIFLDKQSFLDALIVAIALAVAAIPEALGSIVTIVLSISTQKMVKENAIIKNLNAVESLGCVNVILSDKTGTLTQNKMTVTHFYIDNQILNKDSLNIHYYTHQILFKACLLCNDAVMNGDNKIGDPTELALLEFVKRHSNKELVSIRKDELPFDSQRKLMSVSSLNHIYTKGAFDILIKRCDSILLNGRVEKLTKRHVESLENKNKEFAKNGLRVLAFAYKKHQNNHISFEDENHLTFIALVSLIDPPKEGSYEAVKKCKEAGIKPIMITGDHIITAKAIAKTLGIYKKDDLYLEGKKLDRISDYELSKILPKISVYARVTPTHKMRIVKLWQKQGSIVAMSGDGVNDAPALKQSDIGIAMGKRGSEVCKDAADFILSDDNFSTIIQAVMTGRNVYNHIQNAILYLLSGNFAGIICVFLASILILPTPFYAVHLLFINLITDSLPAIAIGMEENHPNVLKEKPRGKKDKLLNKEAILQIVFEGIIIALCTMCSYFMGLKYNSLSASTMAFSTMCIARLLHGFNCRDKHSLFQIGFFSNKASLYAFIIGFILLHIILFVPSFHSLFLIQTLSLIQLICIYGFAVIPTLIIQLQKSID